MEPCCFIIRNPTRDTGCVLVGHRAHGWQVKLGPQAPAVQKHIKIPTAGMRSVLPLSWSLFWFVEGHLLVLSFTGSSAFSLLCRYQRQDCFCSGPPDDNKFLELFRMREIFLQYGKPHPTKHLFSFLNLISCLNSFT